MALLDELKKAIESSGQSRYAISKASGVSESNLSRFMSGERGLTVESAEKVAEALGLEVALRKHGKSRR